MIAGKPVSMTMKALFITVAVGAALFYTPPVSACSCVRGTDQSEFTFASAVFEGEWLKNTDAPPGERAEFRIVRIWKGLEHNPEKVELSVPAGLDFCGFPTSHLTRTPGAMHLVYANEKNAQLSISMCGRFMPLAAEAPFPTSTDIAAADLEFLATVATARVPTTDLEGDARTPVPDVGPPPTPRRAGEPRGCRVEPNPPALELVLLLLTMMLTRRRSGQ